MTPDVWLLYPEWQGYGESSGVYQSAHALVDRIFPERDFIRVNVPTTEQLYKKDGVLGLDSMVARFSNVLDDLRSRHPDRIITVGGTCGAEIAPVAYLNEHYDGDLAVLWFDAHADLNTPASSPSGHFHGMVLRTLLGDGPGPFVRGLKRILNTYQLILAGTRVLDAEEAACISEHDITVVADGTPLVSVVNRVREKGIRRIYIHLDVDVLNPDYFPHSLIPVPGGPDIATFTQVLRLLFEEFDVVGFSIVEFRERSDAAISSLEALFEQVGITT